MLLLFEGCITYTQKTEINTNGSGEISITYSARKNNIILGKIDGFAFTERKARANYESTNTDITELKVVENTSDSTISVSVKLSFKDFNKLSLAKGFSKCKPSWQIHQDTIFFSFIVLPDSSVKEIPEIGGSLHFEYHFPTKIIQTNGKKDGKTVSWDFNIKDLSRQQELTAILYSKKSTCGIFGIELPLLLIGYIAVIFYRKKIRINPRY